MRVVTLSVAWIRNVGAAHQLVFASDSRLRFGRAWDCCPKVFTLPRTDCLTSFAGNTHYAYPLLLQLRNTVAFHRPSLRREVDLAATKGHVLRMFNQMRGLIHDLPAGETSPGDPEALFLFGGYSWREKAFRIWVIRFILAEERFIYQPILPWPGDGQEKTVMFVGDAVPEAKERLRELLDQHGRLRHGGLDMEPLEVLRDMIINESHKAIGGPPQVAKVYEHMDSQEFALYWPPRGDGLTVMGRPAMPYEAFDVPVLDIEEPGREPTYLAREAVEREQAPADTAEDLEAGAVPSTE
jgi:hypothetical protein